jgi:FtsP/CotA-like multicopper oxidase with cupredoxin domain
MRVGRREMLRRTAAAGLGVPLAQLALDHRVLAPPAAAPITLPATPATITVWPNQPTLLQTYGGIYPSPTLRARKGDVVDVTLENQLTEPTNIHWHGLTVPADMDGHPMDVIAPGSSFRYTFPILDTAGTYWYHPHPDMITAPQVYKGMAGFFLVEDDDEAALGLPSGEFDVPLLLQDRKVFGDGSFTYALQPGELGPGYLGDAVLVNGVPDARIKVASAAYRFRFLNGSNARIFRLAFDDRRAFHVIAGDGGLLEAPIAANELFLSPGERAEIYVDFSRSTGTPAPRLVSRAFSPFGTIGARHHHGLATGAVPQGDPMPVLRFAVSGTGPTPPLPARLIPRRRLGRHLQKRRFIMRMGMPPAHGNLTINGLAYDPNRVDAHVERGATEIWEVINASDHPHPWHVHATQFEVVKRNNRPIAPHETGRKDTLLLWPGDIAELKLRFDHYPGMYVFHCHNLEHEDAMMMATLMVM